MAKSVRMAEIAQKLGISIVSVSKGLSGKEGVSDEMRARILATAREMGYQMPARAEAPAQRSANIGILTTAPFIPACTGRWSTAAAAWATTACWRSLCPRRRNPAPCPPC